MQTASFIKLKQDFYRDVEKMLDYFDTSDYSPDHFLHSVVNKKVFGKFKDEMNGVPIKGFVRLKPKMYSLLSEDDVEKCVGKGIPKATLKNQLTYDDFKLCHQNIGSKMVNFSKISKDQRHHVF